MASISSLHQLGMLLCIWFTPGLSPRLCSQSWSCGKKYLKSDVCVYTYFGARHSWCCAGAVGWHDSRNGFADFTAFGGYLQNQLE